MFKNVASQKIAVFAFDTTSGAAKTGDAANVSVYVSKDFGAVTQLTDTSATEMDATNAKGWYLFDVSQTEANADALLFTGKSSTSNISVVGQLIYTLPANFSTLSVDSSGRVDVIKIAGATQTAGDVGIKTGFALTAAYDPAKTASQAGDAMALTAGERNSTADAFLNRDMSTGTDSGSPTVRTVRQALRFLRNKWSVSAGTLTITKEDDTTASWTSTMATDAAAVPIIGSDPA